MFGTFDIIYYILLFIAIYFQVFFLVVFFEKRGELKGATVDDLTDYPSVSFLIPCWNEESTAVKTVESVLAVDYPKDKLHIFAIDDGSTDKTWENLSVYKNHPQVTLLKKENGGKHSALNLALEYVKTDLVASFDADTTINSDSLKNAVAYFLRDKELMALGGAVLIEKPKSMAQHAQSIEYQMFSYTKKMLGLVSGVLVVPGAFSIFRKEVFDKVGGYRKGHNLEDLELTFRIQANGYKVDHCHTAIVTTKGPHSIKSLFKQRLRWGYGFLNNICDYYKMFFNKRFGNFGFFTLPMSAFSYVLIVFVFFYSLYKISYFMYEYILKLYLVGISGGHFTFDLFFVDTRPVAFLAIFMYIMIVVSILMGKNLSKVKYNSPKAFIYFAILYSVLAPLWILKTIYNWAFSRHVAWR